MSSIVERVLEAIQAPAWLVCAIDGHARRRKLVMEIAMLGGRDCAFVALWLSRWAAICSPDVRGHGIERTLRMFRDNLLRGGSR